MDEAGALDVTAELARWPLLGQVGAAAVQELAGATRVVHVPRDQLLFPRGTPASSFYGVVSGLVQLTVSNPDGVMKVVDLIRPGQTLGEAAMFLRRPFPVDAWALEDSVLLQIPASALDELLDTDAAVARAMLASLSVRLHTLVRDMEMITLRTAGQRLARYLIEELDRASATVRLRPSKRVVASLLGMTPETLSRTLHTLLEQGLIAVAGPAVTVLDAAALARYAEDGDPTLTQIKAPTARGS